MAVTLTLTQTQTLALTPTLTTTLSHSGRFSGGSSRARGSNLTRTLPLTPTPTLHAEWLVQRRIVSSTWQKSLRLAHAKLESALEEARPDVAGIELVLPPGRTCEGVTYFDVVAVLKLLKEAGRGEKSFLGAYTDSTTARWAEVVKRYEAGAVCLVDAANYLVQNVSYELPALKKELMRGRSSGLRTQERADAGRGAVAFAP